MATLDRFIQLMFEKDGTAVRLASNQPVTLEVNGAARPATREPIPPGKVMALIKKIMPEGMHQQFEGEDGRLAFGYIANGNRVDVETDRSGQQVSAMLSPAKPRRSTAAISRPAEALLMEAPAQTASHPSKTTADPPSPQRRPTRHRPKSVCRICSAASWIRAPPTSTCALGFHPCTAPTAS